MEQKNRKRGAASRKSSESVPDQRPDQGDEPDVVNAKKPKTGVENNDGLGAAENDLQRAKEPPPAGSNKVDLPASRKDPPRRKRKRRKRDFRQVVEQMEFYFSDANLSKSKFMAGKLENDGPWMDLDVFLTFNKLADILLAAFGRVSVDDIWAALVAVPSDLLEVRESPPPTKVRQVRRTKPVVAKEPEAVDLCTVYVENLPAGASNDWLKGLFSAKFGAVDYVSLPRFRHNRAIKGFAFVEFGQEQGARKALEFYTSGAATAATAVDAVDKGGATGPASTRAAAREALEEDPSKLQSIVAFQREQAIDAGLEGKDGGSGDDEEDDDGTSSCSSSSSSSSSASSSSSSTSSTLSQGKAGQEQPSFAPGGNQQQPAGSSAATGGKRKRGSRKRKRRRIRKGPGGGKGDHPNFGGHCRAGALDENQVLSSMRVLSKKEWRKLRNKYLNLQRDNMKAAKAKIRKLRPFKPHHNDVVGGAAAQQHQQQPPHHHQLHHHPRPPQPPQPQPTAHPAAAAKKDLLEFVPGVIVRFALEEPVADNGKQFKDRVKASTMEPVKYVDAVNGSLNVHVRCSSQKQAETLADVKNLAGGGKAGGFGEILRGEEEARYWAKIRTDRDDRISGKVQVARKKERGRDRTVKRYEQVVANNSHKYFEDADD